MGKVGDFAGSYAATINNIEYNARQYYDVATQKYWKYWVVGVPFVATQDTDDVWSSCDRTCNFSTVFKIKKGQTYYFYADFTEQLYIWNKNPWANKRGSWCNQYEYAGNTGKYWGEPCVAPYLIGTKQIANIASSNSEVAYVTRPQDSSKSPFPMGTYDVKFNSNTTDTVTNMPSTQTKQYNVDLKLDFTPSRFGYKFLGWTKSSNDNLYVTSYTENKSITFYAQWEVITYSITYDINIPSEYDNKVVANISSRNDIKYHGKNYSINSTATIYDLTESVTINYINNQKWVSSSVNLKDSFMHKFSFLGWNTKSDGTGTTYKNGDKDITLYAKWHPYRDSDLFEVNKLSQLNMSEYQSYLDGTSYFAKFYPRTPDTNVRIFRNEQCYVKEVWHFTGWNTKSDGTGISFTDGNSYSIDTWLGLTTLYGQWELTSSDYQVLDSISEPKCNGYTFLGWMHDNDIMESDSSFEVVTDTEYFGVWKVDLTDDLLVMYNAIASQLYSWHSMLYRMYKKKNSKGIEVFPTSEFSTTLSYSKGDIVCNNNVLYIAKSNTTAGDFKDSEWTSLVPYKDEKITKNHINNIFSAIKYLYNNCSWYKNSGIDFSYFIGISPIKSINKLDADMKNKLTTLLISADSYLTLKG